MSVSESDTIPFDIVREASCLTDVGTGDPALAASSDAPIIEPCILRIVPANEKARKAFHELIVKKHANELHPHHAQYLSESGKRPLEKVMDNPTREPDETTSEDERDNKAEDEELLFDGHYFITFECLTISTAKWTIGRGSGKRSGTQRNVDILLTAPNSKVSQKPGANHVLLEIHPRSGVWIIRATQRFGFGPKLEEVPEKGFRCLTKPSSSFEVASMQYLINFALDTPETEAIYRQSRDKLFQKLNAEPPKTRISGIPFESDKRVFNSAVFRHGLGSGTSGNVFEGFCPSTGELRAVKYICIKSPIEAHWVNSELQALITFTGSPGIVQLYEWGNSLQSRDTIVNQYPLDFYFVMEKGQSFREVQWGTEALLDWTLRSTLCRELLQGLCAIHRLGWMHRDVTRQNILYFEQEPIHAALCDFGKLCRVPTHTYKRLAALQYLPPELQEGKSNEYNQKLDIWMLGLALAQSWYPHTNHGLKARIFKDHGQILARLRSNHESGLSTLLANMLSWDPQARPSAEEALNNPALRNIDSVSNKRVRVTMAE